MNWKVKSQLVHYLNVVLNTAKMKATLESIENDLKELISLEEGWDGEQPPSPVPSPYSIWFARCIAKWALTKDYTIIDVDADVIGGTAVYLAHGQPDERQVWISCLNDKEPFVLASNGKEIVYSEEFEPFLSFARMERFLE
jgi:hypothetical protein